jgi:hypothetical protein
MIDDLSRKLTQMTQIKDPKTGGDLAHIFDLIRVLCVCLRLKL